MKSTYTRGEVRYMLAAAMFHRDSFDWEPGEIGSQEMVDASVEDYNKIIKPAVEHFGDCVKVPQTCEKCLQEEYLAAADAVLICFDSAK